MPVSPSHVHRGLHQSAAVAVRLLAAGALLLAACAAGCGGSGQRPDARTDPASVTQPAKTAGPGGGSEAPDPARRPGAAAPVPASEGGSVAAPGEGGGKPAQSVLLVTVDTLRADRLGCYGATSPATPAFDRIAREGTIFENAVATNPLTLPSHVSMLTGRYPAQHGVRGNGNFALPSGERTLATLLADAGFETAAFVGAFPLAYRFGLGRGFKVYDDDFGSMDSPAGRRAARSERRAREVNARALAWLSGPHPGRFFLWVHYFDPHFEYVPEEPFASRYAGSPYDGEVAATDAALGELLGALDRLGLAGSTAVLVIGDHGEGLGDHGEAFHGVFLYDATIRIPFLLRAPGLVPEGKRAGAPVSGADVAPTVLRLLGIPVPPFMSGRTAPFAAGTPGPFLEDAVLCESYGPWFEFGWSPLLGLRNARWKFVEAPTPEIYDLAADPGETRNLAAEKPDLLARARGLLDAKRAATGGAGQGETGGGMGAAPARAAGRGSPGGTSSTERAAAHGADAGRPGREEPTAAEASRGASEEELERLRSLGYAASGAAPRLPGPGRALRDPKEMHGFEEAYYRAFTLINAGRFEEAIGAYRAMLARDPDAPLVHHQLGRALRKAKQYPEAERQFREALRLAPDLAEAAFDVGAVREALSDAAGAERWYHRALEINAAFPEAHAALARLRRSAGDLEGARAELRAALALAPSDPLYRQALASLEPAPR